MNPQAKNSPPPLRFRGSPSTLRRSFGGPEISEAEDILEAAANLVGLESEAGEVGRPRSQGTLESETAKAATPPGRIDAEPWFHSRQGTARDRFR